jgi:predicted transcriptional regulator of viral defense system
MSGVQLTDDFMARGRYHFTTDEAHKHLCRSLIATRAVLRRLNRQGRIATPLRGFHVVVPPEYKSIGCLPPEQLIPALMDWLNEPYYVGLLSAAELHGAAHQRPQQFNVVVRKNRPDIRCRTVHIIFIARKNVTEMPVKEVNTPRGTVKISTPEATAIDIIAYPHYAGGLDNIATLLAELADVINPGSLAILIEKIGEIPVGQRLGYLLDRIGREDVTKPLAGLVRKKALHTAPLMPSLPVRGVQRDKKWNLFINAHVEVET